MENITDGTADLASSRHRVFLIGPSGSGKTVVARKLAEAIGWRFIDTDDEVRQAAGLESIAEIFDRYGESAFRALEIECLNRIAVLKDPVVVATGGGLPVSAGSLDRILEVGVPVYLRASINTLWHRLTMYPEGLADRPLLRSGGVEVLQDLMEARQQVYMRASVILDTDYLSLGEVVDMLSGMLKPSPSAAIAL